MLNKEICKKCWKNSGRSGFGQVNDEYPSWWCVYVSYMLYDGSNIPDKCPFKLEHEISNVK
jgi:hypothetical protein